MPHGSAELLRQTQAMEPTCRRGEGFATSTNVDRGTIKGQAVPFGKIVKLGPDLYERFLPGAFQRQVKDPARVKLCLEHGQVIGKCSSLAETLTGLGFVAGISTSNDIPEARRARGMLDEDLVDELSVGFQTVEGGTDIERRDDGSTLMTHRRARLMEISLVPWGVYGREATLARSVLVDPGDFHVRDEMERHRAAAREWIRQHL